MARLLLRQFASLIIVILGVTIIAFALSYISPIDPAEQFVRAASPNPKPEQIEQIRIEMGLDKPIHIQYLIWIKNALRGDFGISVQSKKPVLDGIISKLPATFRLVGMSMGWVLIFSIPIGLLTAIYKNGVFDNITKWITIIGISIPSFWLGFLLLILFTMTIPLFRVVDTNSLKGMILPSLTVAIPISCIIIRMLRATALSCMESDYVFYARARGVSEKRIVCIHVLRNAMPPMVTMFCQYLGSMFAGSAIVEALFSLGGIGSHLLSAIVSRNLPVINASVLIISIVFVLCNFAADVLNMALNPRLREEVQNT